MKSPFTATAVIILLVGLVTVPLFAGAHDEPLEKRKQEFFEIPDGKSNGFFTENLGQWDEDILFMGETSFGQIGLGKGCVYFNMREISKTDEILPGLEGYQDPMMDPLDQFPTKVEVKGHVVKYTFEDSNDAVPIGVDPIGQLNNYFYGSDPDRWVRGARNFETIVYQGLYENIDLKYYFNEKGAKYDLILTSHADPDDIRIKVEGHDSLDLHNNDLVIDIKGDIRIQDRNLVTYQQDDMKVLSSSFKLIDKNTYGFDLSNYDDSKTTVIDPMIFSTYLGGNSYEYQGGIVEDSMGDPIIWGSSTSTNFPSTPGTYDRILDGYRDIVVTKMYGDGTRLQWSTFIGGSGGTSEHAVNLFLDSYENIWIRGYSDSTDFPTTLGAYRPSSQMKGASDLFIMKLKNDGSDILASTFIGGDGTDTVYGIGFDIKPNGNVVSLSRVTQSSTNFPTTSGAFDRTFNGTTDMVLFEMKSDCMDLVFSTYIGGISTDAPSSLEVRPNGELWVGGNTGSTDFPVSKDAMDKTLGGTGDLFFIKMKSDGSGYIYSTFIGGSSHETLSDMKLGIDDDLYFVGSTSSTDFPKTVGQSLKGQNDMFVMKIMSNLSGVIYSRLMGGSDQEYSQNTIMINEDDEIVVAGTTISTDFPVTSGAFDTTYGGGYNDAFVFKLSGDGSNILGSTYLGGNDNDAAVIELGPNGEVYAALQTNSTNLFTTYDADDRSKNGLYDAYFAEFYNDLSGVEYASYYGGDNHDYGSFYINRETWNLYLFGQTNSADFPTTSGAYDDSIDGANDLYLVKLIEGAFGGPLEVYTVNSFEDEDYAIQKSSFDIGETVYIELRGLDSDENKTNSAKVNISFGFSPLHLLRISLRETGNNTGVYQGKFIIPPGTIYCDTIEITSRKDPVKGCNLFIEPPFRPLSVNFLEVYSDPACTVSVDKLDKGDSGYVKIIGLDADPSASNKALANVTSVWNSSFRIPFVLDETGESTGIYIGRFDIPVNRDYYENFTINSVRDEAIIDTFMIHTPVQIRPLVDVTTAYEDEEYRIGYWNFGYEEGTWSMDTLAKWLSWDEDTQELHGIPNNNQVGPWDVLIRLEDTKGHEDVHEFTISVLNTPPNITIEPILTAVEGEEYYIDFNCTDDGQGDMEWSVIPNKKWLMIKERTGELSGVPTYEDVGILNVSVIVKDGNGGIGSIDFHITVEGVNDPPRITTMDIRTGKQGENYYRKYEAHDPEGDAPLIWSLETNAKFLDMEANTGILSGTPGKFDVGEFLVNVTVSDPHGANATTSFTLTIENVNDIPDWVDVPEDVEIIHGHLYQFDVNATDPDPGGFIEYQVETDPETGMDIDGTTGELDWIASVLPFSSSPFELEVTIRASDGELFNRHEFTITVIPTASPTATIWGPDDDEKVPSDNCVLEWVGTDPEEESLTFNLYLHENQAYVVSLREEALYLSDFEGNSMTINDVEEGKTYYWMVLPYDGCTVGDCEAGVRSFKVNYKPTITSIQPQEVKAGEDFTLKISASDQDLEDSGSLLHTLTTAPSGMTILEDTGTIRWKPSSSQEGTHTVTVEVSDGVETTSISFDIEVLKDDESDFPVGLAIGIAAVVLFVIIIILLFFLLRKKKDEDKDDEDEETARIKKEMDLHQQEMEWEKQYIKPHDPSDDNSSVSLSAAEAHAHDKDKRYDQPDYEELYGQPAPEIEEEDVSIEDLKNSFGEVADELERIEHPEE